MVNRDRQFAAAGGVLLAAALALQLCARQVNGFATWYAPVSYTHLDVYKRQRTLSVIIMLVVCSTVG